MKTLSLVLVIISAFIYTAATFASGPDIRPGLWKYQVDMKSESGQVEAAMAQAKAMLASVPPEQRAMVEQMMQSRGANFDLDTQSFETCITSEDIKTMNMPEPDEKCEQSLVKKSDNKFKMTVSCAGDPPMQGVGEFWVVNKKEVGGKVLMDVTLNGQPDKITMRQTGTWVQDSCQN